MPPKAKAKGAAKPKGLTKPELIRALADTTGLSRSQVDELFEALCKVIEGELRAERPFALLRLLKIKFVRKPAKPARMGRNPATGQEMLLKAKPASNSVKVTALKALKEMVL